MNLGEFYAIIKETGLSEKVAKKPFAKKSKDDGDDDDDDDEDGGVNDNNLLKFADFLSSIAKIGMWRYHGGRGKDDTTLTNQICKSIDDVSRLAGEVVDEVDCGGDRADSVSDVTNSIAM